MPDSQELPVKMKQWFLRLLEVVESGELDGTWLGLVGQLFYCHLSLSHNNSFNPHGNPERYIIWWFSIPFRGSQNWGHERLRFCPQIMTKPRSPGAKACAFCSLPHFPSQEETPSWRMKNSPAYCRKSYLNWLCVGRATCLPDNNFLSFRYSLSSNFQTSESWLLQLSNSKSCN